MKLLISNPSKNLYQCKQLYKKTSHTKHDKKIVLWEEYKKTSKYNYFGR